MKDGKNAFFKMLDYLEDRGFYIILTLCIASIAISGYVFFFSDNAGDKANKTDKAYLSEIPLKTLPEDDVGKEASGQAEITVTVPDRDQGAKESTTSAQSEQKIKIPSVESVPTTQTAKNESKEQSTAQASKSVGIKENPATPEQKTAKKFCRPVPGKVVHGFSNEQLEYSPTMDDWRAHNGTDFEAEIGQKVSAVMAGTIEDVYEDQVFGTCVVIAHENDKKTVYTGLMKQTAVKKGDSVDAGTIIGGVGDTSVFEAAESGRLHVEYINDGKYQNIESILPTE